MHWNGLRSRSRYAAILNCKVYYDYRYSRGITCHVGSARAELILSMVSAYTLWPYPYTEAT